MKVLVVPSNRENCLKEFLAAWENKGGWDQIIIVEDAPKRSQTIVGPLQYSWQEISEETGDNAWIFSKRDSAIRCFGLWKAWQIGADYVLTLDDDCFPVEKAYGNTIAFFDKHKFCIGNVPRWVDSALMRTRGMPYRNLGQLDTIKANIGLWEKHPDYDSIQCLSSQISEIFQYPCAGQRVIPHGQYFPVCGMNLCIKREAIPLFYFPLMGQDQPYSRFDDIWAGIIAKKVMDHLGWQMSVGEPFVEHRKASDPFTNLVKEAPGIGANETLWQVVDGVCLSGYNPLECMRQLGRQLETFKDMTPYVRKMGKAIQVWANLFQEN